MRPCFNKHPPLGVNATPQTQAPFTRSSVILFQRAPTLGGECYTPRNGETGDDFSRFQRAPTLGGECYLFRASVDLALRLWFQRAPTLGGECYGETWNFPEAELCLSFNGHPPLGVNATLSRSRPRISTISTAFQRAPTLGGECY